MNIIDFRGKIEVCCPAPDQFAKKTIATWPDPHLRWPTLWLSISKNALPILATHKKRNYLQDLLH